MIKKAFMAAVVISLLLLIPVYDFAATDNQPTVELDGTKIQAAVYIDGGNVYLPLRAVGEALGYNIKCRAD